VTSPAFDISDRAFKADPHPTYAYWRAETPVVEAALPMGGRGYLVARYDDVSALLKDPRLVKDPVHATSEEASRRRRVPRRMRPLVRNMLALDDPDHARLKRLVQAAFTPRRTEALADRTRETAERLLDRVAGRARFDLIADFALPLPVAVISELLGVPERDRAKFARWSHSIISLPESPLNAVVAMPHIFAFMGYLEQLVAAKRSAPADDLVSALAEIEAQGERLDGDELLAMIAILLSAGHETTTNLIGNGVLALLQHPQELERLRAEPDLVGPAIEELLRFAGPVEMSTPRFAREDLEIAGTRIPRGAQVFGVITSANRDGSRFEDPDRLDLARARNRHLTFGEGGHYCVGAALARMEGRVALPLLLDRFPRLALAEPSSHLRWRASPVLRGLKRLSLSAKSP
jgi:cytochrome P450